MSKGICLLEFNFEVQRFIANFGAVVCIVLRAVLVRSQLRRKNVSWPNMSVNGDASTCVTALAGQAQRHRSRATLFVRPKMRIILSLLLALAFTSSAFCEESIRSKLLGFEAYIVYGSNMEPTIHRDELVYVETKTLATTGPLRGDIVAYHSRKLRGAIVVMRTIARAGDSVELREGQLFVNDSAIAEKYVDPKRAKKSYSRTFKRTLVPRGAVFVLGDSRDDSNDSRFLGPVALAEIVGRVTLAKESWLTGTFRDVH